MSAMQLLRMPRKAFAWLRLANSVLATRRQGGDPRQNRNLSKQLASQRGLAMKTGQIFAGVTGESALKPLITSVEPFPLKRMRRVLRAQCKKPLEEIFIDIEESRAAASLGQVHRATLRDGRRVALKIRYPGIVDTVKAELGLIGLLPAAGPAKRWCFDLAGYKQQLRNQVLRELDYRIEAATQARLKANLNIRGLHIPEVIPELCTKGLLVQSWASGERFERVCSWSQSERLEVGRILLTTLFQGLFVFGEVHGDPHTGNYLFQRNDASEPQVNLLDFGATVSMSREQRLSLLTLLIACRRGKPFDVAQCFVLLGFDREKLERISAELGDLCAILFKPFVSPRPFHCRDWRLNTEMNRLLQERRWWFRSAAPAELFPWMRIFHGLIEQLNALDIALPWWPLLEHCVGKELLAAAEAAIPPPVTREIRKEASAPALAGTARTLRIRIDSAERSPAIINFPADEGLQLKEFMPEEIYRKLVSAGLSGQLDTLEKRLKTGTVQNEPVLDRYFDEKRIRAWLIQKPLTRDCIP
ncbi:MAG: AarF/UbiB family protein [Gammaproteobacteria bacterium]